MMVFRHMPLPPPHDEDRHERPSPKFCVTQFQPIISILCVKPLLSSLISSPRQQGEGEGQEAQISHTVFLYSLLLIKTTLREHLLGKYPE